MEDTNYNTIEVMTRQQVRDFDCWAIHQKKIPGIVLMENAGRGAAELLIDLFPDKSTLITIFAGLGNNGGDGFVIARHLLNNGYTPRTLIIGPPEKITGDARTNLDILREIKAEIYEMSFENADFQGEISQILDETEVVVDSIFGTGLQGDLRPGYPELFDMINSATKRVFAVDIPSGLDCDTGKPLGTAIKADDTASFVAIKKGYLLPDSREYIGKIHVVSIGLSPSFAQ